MADLAFTGDPVSTPPFVDDKDDKDKGGSQEDVVAPDSEEGAAALEDDFDEDISDKVDVLINKIDDLITLGKIDKLIDSLNEAFDDSMPEEKPSGIGVRPGIGIDDGGADIPANIPDSMPDELENAPEEEPAEDNTEKEAAMATIKKRAAEEQTDKTLSADEVLDQVVDQGTMFDQAQDEAHDESTVPDSANVGDNYAGSQETVSDTEDLKPVTTSAAMRLADAYIRAGVLKEADRYNAIDRIASTMTRTAARNQLRALDLARKASVNKKVVVRKTAADELTITTDPGFSATLNQTEDGNVDGVINGEQQTFDTMDEAIQYVADNAGLDIDNTDNTGTDDDITAARRRRSARRTIRRRTAGRRMTAVERRRLAARVRAARRRTARRSAGHRMTAAERQRLVRKIRAARHSSTNTRSAFANRSMASARTTAGRHKTAGRRMTAAERQRLASRIKAARRSASASTNRNMISARKTALAAARRKAARTPRLASATVASSNDASAALI